MIKSISIITNSIKHNYAFDQSQEHKISIDLAHFELLNYNSFDIEIIFNESILEFRNHDYNWVKCNEDRIANELCPKIIRLDNGQLIQSNIQKGIWEINKKNPHILLWRFNPESAENITNYTGYTNKKIISRVRKRFNFPEKPALLFPADNALEFSRSKYPFTAIVCFTDHCDFDTLENLALQRKLFNENQIKITKGFFLNHFSKRPDNASFENDKEELLKWKDDGHELCYHSLSQSIKPDFESFEDFTQFDPPFSDLKVWIDHGYQPYNFSLLLKNKFTEEEFEKTLSNKNINVLWNYIDSGTSTTGVINQLNSKHFTLSSFSKGNKNQGFVKKVQLIIKNIIFHYYNDENMIQKYKNTAGNFKNVIYQKKLKSIFPLIKDTFSLGISIFSVVLFWQRSKDKPYKLAKYSPLIFRHLIDEKEFVVFQTLEMLDFEKSLSKNNIRTLISEKGVFIAHTYFSVPMEYHVGRLFSKVNTINNKAADNFKLLGEKIIKKEIWNPTLSELVLYWEELEKTILDINKEGIVFSNEFTILHSREIN